MKIQNTTFLASSEHSGCFVHGDGRGDPYEMEELALKFQPDAQAQGYFCAAGVINDEGYGLYLIPASMGLRKIIEEFAVGSHADAEPVSVFSEIEEANRLNPLTPYFVDSAGFKAKFTEPVSKQLISILEENLFSAEAMMDEDEGSIAAYIEKNRGIHLWWD